MTNTKITRTINTATAIITFFNDETEAIEKKTVSVATTQRVSEKEFKKIASVDGLQVLKVSNITYESGLYEMDLSTFLQYADKVGEGRTTL